MRYAFKLMMITAGLLLISTLLFANDPAKEYSVTKNPAGMWSYGYSTTLGSRFILFTAWRINGWQPRDDIWYNPNAALSPVIERDLTENYTTPVDGCGFLAPGSLVEYPGPNDGEYATLRWTAPISGTYNLRGYWQGNQGWHFCPTYHGNTADVHVRWNTSAPLFDGNIISPGDVVFFDLMQPVNASDTLDFSAGPAGDPGPNKSHGQNFQLTIDLVPGVLIIPGSPRNQIGVAILSDAALDATSMVVRNALTFGRIGNEQSLVYDAQQHPLCSTRDVNLDGRPDLVCAFDSQKAGFLSGDTEAVLQGTTTVGMTIRAIKPFHW